MGLKHPHQKLHNSGEFYQFMALLLKKKKKKKTAVIIVTHRKFVLEWLNSEGVWMWEKCEIIHILDFRWTAEGGKHYTYTLLCNLIRTVIPDKIGNNFTLVLCILDLHSCEPKLTSRLVNC